MPPSSQAGVAIYKNNEQRRRKGGNMMNSPKNINLLNLRPVGHPDGCVWQVTGSAGLNSEKSQR